MNTRTIPSSLAETFQLARSTNPTASSFTLPGTTLPADAKPMGPGQSVGANGVFVQPMAVGADNVTGTVRVYGISGAEDGSYDATLAFEATFTACTDTVTLSNVVHRFADGFGTPTVGTPNVDCVIKTGVANARNGVYVDLFGSTHYYVDAITGTATSVNARCRKV